MAKFFRGAADDGGTLEYIFETDQRDVPATVTKDKVAEIAAEFMTTFYHVQIGALETQELRTAPTPFWLVCFSDAIKGPLRQLFFVVVMPDGTIIEPRVAKRLWDECRVRNDPCVGIETTGIVRYGLFMISNEIPIVFATLCAVSRRSSGTRYFTAIVSV